jgi:diacylglycerol kinase (ATP)
VVVNAVDRAGRLGELTLGFVPLGTANDLATHLGMSSDPRVAARQLVEGHRATLDAMRLEGDRLDRGEIVVNALHAGLGVDGARRGGPLKPVLGPLAYPVGVAASGVVSRGHQVTIRVDGTDLDIGSAVLAVSVSNAPRLGGVELMAEADPTDGRLDLLVVPARPWRARLGSVLQAAGRTPEALETTRGRVVELEGDIGEVDADGEMIDVGRRCRVELVPAAIQVLRPPPA